MEKTKLMNEVLEYTNKRSGLEAQLAEKQKELKELVDAQDQYKKKSDLILKSIENEIGNISRINNIENARFTRSYSEKLNTLLKGPKGQDAMDKIEAVERIISNKISDTEDEIRFLKDQIAMYNSMILNTNSQLRSL